MTGDRRASNRLHRPKTRASVVLSDHHDQGGDDQTGNAAIEQFLRAEGFGTDGHRGNNQLIYDPPKCADRQHASHDQALIERAHDVLRLAQTHGEGTDD